MTDPADSTASALDAGASTTFTLGAAGVTASGLDATVITGPPDPDDTPTTAAQED